MALSGAHRTDLDNGRCSGGNRRLSGVILRVRMGLVHQIIISTECVLRLNPLRLYYRLQCIQFYLAIGLSRHLLLNDLCKERSLYILQISDRNELRCRLGLHRWGLGQSRIVHLLYKGVVGAVGCLVAAAALDRIGYRCWGQIILFPIWLASLTQLRIYPQGALNIVEGVAQVLVSLLYHKVFHFGQQRLRMGF